MTTFLKLFRGFMRCPLRPCTHLCCTWIHWSRSLRGWGLSRPRFLSNGGLRRASPFEFWPTDERRRREGLVASEVAAKSNKNKRRWQTIENTHKVQCNYECLTRIILDCICKIAFKFKSFNAGHRQGIKQLKISCYKRSFQTPHKTQLMAFLWYNIPVTVCMSDL